MSSARAQIAIGTLVVFIALVLVATITVAVLFDVTDTLQLQTEETGAETEQQLSERLEVVSASGSNITDSDGTSEIHRVEIVLTNADGADPVDLRNLTVQWHAGETTVLSHSTQTVAREPGFELVQLTDPDDTFPVLSSSNDRFGVVFEPGVTFGEGLSAGERVEVTLLSPAGSTHTARLTVPRSLLGQTSVEL